LYMLIKINSLVINDLATSLYDITCSHVLTVHAYTLLLQWTQELGENEKMFQKHAQQIYDWDKTLTVNAEKIVELHDNLDAVQADHNRQVFLIILSIPNGCVWLRVNC